MKKLNKEQQSSYKEGEPMQQNSNEAQQAALYGPAGRGEYAPGERITFASSDTGGESLTGEVLYVRAPAPAIRGGRVLPACYIVFVVGETFIRVVQFCDVVTTT